MFPISAAPSVPTLVSMHPVPSHGLQQRLLSCIDGAEHLAEQAPTVKALAIELLRTGHVHVAEASVARFHAVTGVQWAMEQVLEGTEFVVTPERATPLRTHGDDPQAPEQRTRKDGLLKRLENGNHLHLVFCAEGVGTPEQDRAYRRDILTRYGPESGKPVLHEHLLPQSKAEFPGEASGAFILASSESEATAFAIQATQAHRADQGRSIELYFGPIQDPVDDPGNTLAHKLAFWADKLQQWCNLDCLGIARTDRA
jgi:hypothetical protein